VDLETWNAVQKILSLHSNLQHVTASERHPRRRSQTATYLLSGIAYCGRCNSPLYGMTSKQRSGAYYHRYACTRQHRRRDCDFKPVPAKALEHEVIDHLTAFYDDPGNLAALLEADQQRRTELASKSQDKAQDLQKQLKPLRRSISNITKAIKAHGHSKAMLAELTTLEGQESDLLSQLETVKTANPTPRQPLTAHQITILSGRIAARLRSQDPATQRSVLYGTVNQVIIDRTPKYAFGIIRIHSPREPETPDEPAGSGIITASITRAPVGAQLHTRSIEFQFPIAPRGHSKKSRPS
jgi:hypothetical protein